MVHNFFDCIEIHIARITVEVEMRLFRYGSKFGFLLQKNQGNAAVSREFFRMIILIF